MLFTSKAIVSEGEGKEEEEEAKLTFLFSSVPLGSYGDSPFRGDGGGRRRKPYDSDWNSFCPNQTPIFPPGLLCYARIMEARSNEGEEEGEGERNAWSRKSKKKRRESLGSLVIPMEKYIYIRYRRDSSISNAEWSATIHATY